MSSAVPFGPTGQVVFDRTYSRTRRDGSKETWPETVRRVVLGNLGLVYKNGEDWTKEVWDEAADLRDLMENFAILPAGRHLWSTGVPGRQYLQNCWVAGWGKKLSEHFEFSFLRLMEGGGVGSNYSTKNISKFGKPKRKVDLNIVCDPNHPDYTELVPNIARVQYAPSIGWKYDQGVPDGYEVVFADGEIVEDSREGWAAALVDLIDMFMSPTEYRYDITRVYDVGGVRPSGAPLKTFGGTASGPAPFARMMHEVARVMNDAYDSNLTPMHLMEIDHAIAECVVSGGNRRSARMSMLHWADPQIFDFIECKRDTGLHWTTNISVEIDDEFLKQLHAVGRTELSNRAELVHMSVCEAVLKNGEPGYWNSSHSQQGEVNPVICTNPCGEIVLEPWEPCNLGHINLDYFAGRSDWLDELEKAHRLMARFLIRATFGDVNDPKSREVFDRNRRIGVGHLGVQGYWAKQGIKYSDIPRYAPSELESLYKTVRKAAREYAFELRIPEPVKVTTVAPTGSVAKLPGVSEGIHPIYSRYFERRVRFSKRDASQVNTVLEAMEAGFTVEDDVYDKSGMTAVVVYPTEDILVQQVRDLGLDPDKVVQSADELTAREMLKVQRTYQKHWADNAVSYTVNVPEDALKPADLEELLAEFLPELKGTTIMVDASRPQAPYTRITKEQYDAAIAKTSEDGTDLECSSGACPIR